MNRALCAILVVVVGLFAGACRTSQPEEPPKPSSGDASGEEKIRFQSEAPAPSTEPGVVDYVEAPFENVVWWPWKIIGTGLKGAVDGVSCGFRPGRMPAVGLIVSPINLVAGLVTGMVEGIAMSPLLVGPRDSFGHTMGLPMRHPTSIWWY
jgi:hypothetical protein